MQAALVVELDFFLDSRPGVEPVLPGMQVNALVFQRLP